MPVAEDVYFGMLLEVAYSFLVDAGLQPVVTIDEGQEGAVLGVG